MLFTKRIDELITEIELHSHEMSDEVFESKIDKIRDLLDGVNKVYKTQKQRNQELQEENKRLSERSAEATRQMVGMDKNY